MNPTTTPQAGYWTNGALDPKTNTVGTGTFVPGTPPPQTPTPVAQAPYTGGQQLSQPAPAVQPQAPARAPVAQAPQQTNPSQSTYQANNAQLTSLQGDQQNVNDTYQQQLQQNFNTLQGIQNGTVPLSPYEQSQIDSTKALLQQAHDAQVLANKNYEGGVTVSQDTQGLSRYSPQMAQGNIYAAVTEGNKKLSALDAQSSLSLAQMEQGFRDNDYNKVKSSFDLLTKAKEEKTSEIQRMYDSVKAENDKLATAQKEGTMNYIGTTLMDPTLSIEDKKQMIAGIVAAGGLGYDDITKIQGDLNKLEDRQNQPSKLEAGVVGEYQYYADQERSSGRAPMSFFDFKNYKGDTGGSGAPGAPGSMNPTTGLPLSPEDQKNADKVREQDALDLQTVNSAYSNIQGILSKYGATPETFNKEVAAKMNDVDAETLGKALARVQSPDIARTSGGDPGNALSPTSIGEIISQKVRAATGGQKYLPEKIVDAVSASVAAKNQRQLNYDNPIAAQAVASETNAQKTLLDYATENPAKKELIATALETPDPAFGNKPPTNAQLLKALQDRGIIPAAYKGITEEPKTYDVVLGKYK